MDLANWALRTSPKFTKEVKYESHQDFLPDQIYVCVCVCVWVCVCVCVCVSGCARRYLKGQGAWICVGRLVLHLKSQTVAVRRRMNMVSDDYDGQMIPGDECGLHFLIFVISFSFPFLLLVFLSPFLSSNGSCFSSELFWKPLNLCNLFLSGVRSVMSSCVI